MSAFARSSASRRACASPTIAGCWLSSCCRPVRASDLAFASTAARSSASRRASIFFNSSARWRASAARRSSAWRTALASLRARASSSLRARSVIRASGVAGVEIAGARCAAGAAGAAGAGVGAGGVGELPGISSAGAGLDGAPGALPPVVLPWSSAFRSASSTRFCCSGVSVCCARTGATPTAAMQTHSQDLRNFISLTIRKPGTTKQHEIP